MWLGFIQIAFGFALAQAGNIIQDHIKRRGKVEERKKATKKILKALYEELSAALGRCKVFMNYTAQDKMSFATLYLGLWDSYKEKFPDIVDNDTIIILFHKILHRFHLITYNLYKNNYEGAMGFIQSYHEEIEGNLQSLRTEIEKEYGVL